MITRTWKRLRRCSSRRTPTCRSLPTIRIDIGRVDAGGLGVPVQAKASQAAHFAPSLSDSQRGNLTMHEMRARGMLVEQHIDSLGPDIVARLLADMHDARRCRALVGSFKAGVAQHCLRTYGG